MKNKDNHKNNLVVCKSTVSSQELRDIVKQKTYGQFGNTFDG